MTFVALCNKNSDKGARVFRHFEMGKETNFNGFFKVKLKKLFNTKFILNAVIKQISVIKSKLWEHVIQIMRMLLWQIFSVWYFYKILQICSVFDITVKVKAICILFFIEQFWEYLIIYKEISNTTFIIRQYYPAIYLET